MPLKPNKKTCHNLLEDTVKGLNTGVTFDHVLCKNTWSNVSWERWIKCIVREVLGKIVVYGCDWSFENLSGSHCQSQVKNCFLVKCCYSDSCNLIGRLTFWPLSFFIQRPISSPARLRLTKNSSLDLDDDDCWGYQIVSHYFPIQLSHKLQYGGGGGVGRKGELIRLHWNEA